MNAHLRLLGGPTLRLGGSWHDPPITRAVSLMSYLAYREAWVDRNELTALFWAETSERKARQNLRALLFKAKAGAHGDALEVAPGRVRCAIATDVRDFVDAVSDGRWRAAVEAYRGTFLARIPGDASTAFEAWLEQTRDELHRSWRDAVLHVAEDLNAAGRVGRAADLLQRLLAYDLLDEEAVQACMRAHAAAGDRARALEIFRTFRENLAAELDMAPLASSGKLAAAIREGAAVGPAQPTRREGRPRARATASDEAAAPRPLTPFVGRLLELLELGNLLTRSDARLVTLLGPGGVGKSRLSLELLERHRRAFEDGAAFVALEGLRSAAEMPSAVASALSLDAGSEDAVADVVCERLRTRSMLVVLDNVEHLLDGGAAFVKRLLDAAPGCKFVCTSRIVLGLGEEVVYDLAGLTVPSSGSSDLETYDAVRLFVSNARRVRSDFKVREADRADLARLCVLLDGLPLALELAATWVRLYEVSDLVGTLETDLDLLASSDPAARERHASLRAVFEHSWRLLGAEEQRVLSSLAVFRGGFDRPAADAVARAKARTLMALIDTSLVRRNASGRFSVLMVVGQYAAERSSSRDADEERHAIHYLGLVERSSDALEGEGLTSASTALHDDLDNLRAAWRWACDHGRFDLCDRVLEPINAFFTGRALLQEGNDFLRSALARLDDRAEPRFKARLHHQLAYFARRLDRHEDAGEHARTALRLAGGLPDARALTIDCGCELAVTGCWIGRFDDAAEHAGRALALAEELRDPDRIARSASGLALARRYQGRFDDALRLYQEVLGHERRLGRPARLIRALSDTGRLWVDLRRPDEAEALFREGLELAERHDLPYELGFMWEGLSQCSYLRRDDDRARHRAETALRYSEAVHDSMGVAIQCADLAKILARQGRSGDARSYLRRALGVAWTRGELPEVLKHFVIWAGLPDEDTGLATTLLSWVVRHPAAQAISRREALELLARREGSALSVDVSAAGMGRIVHGLIGTAR